MASGSDRLSNRYARAFHEVVTETGSSEQTLEELRLMSGLATGEAGIFFRNPTFTHEEKKVVLEKVFAKQAVSVGAQRFLTVLLMQGHLGMLPEICQSFEEAERERLGEVRAFVRSAFPLEETAQGRLTKALCMATGKKVLVETVVDPGLIGGATVTVGSVLYDASVSGYIQRIQQEFSR